MYYSYRFYLSLTLSYKKLTLLLHYSMLQSSQASGERGVHGTTGFDKVTGLLQAGPAAQHVACPPCSPRLLPVPKPRLWLRPTTLGHSPQDLYRELLAEVHPLRSTSQWGKPALSGQCSKHLLAAYYRT